VIAWKIATKHGEIWARGMVDAWCPALKMAVDLKSSTDASLKAVTNKCAREGYDTQAAWYTTGLGHILDLPGQIRFSYLFSRTKLPTRRSRSSSTKHGARAPGTCARKQ
jgi:hypothetical protein